VALDPKRAQCYYNRAMCEKALGRYEQAAADCRRALTMGADLSATEKELARQVIQAEK